MTLRVYNTLTRHKEPFQTVQPGQVGIYLCGPTVYKPSHIGHMVGPVIFDTVKRYLTYLGYRVTLVINITDVDDKLIVQAREQQTTVPELAERVTADYCRNLERLGVTGIDHLPRATEHIGDILLIIEGLIARGHAYPAGGDVYFDVTSDPDYGKLCDRNPEELEAGARIEVSERKRNPGDFALWKGAKPGEPRWESPWGPGRPGWHIECSAMSMRLLGPTLDIHGGGLDLQFPHHENELAQSESYTGVPFVRSWMHHGLMKIGNDKISKSKGNEIVMTELLERHQASTLRFFLLSTHYRRPIDYSEERIEEVRRGLDGFDRFFERFQRITGQAFHALPAPAKAAAFDPATLTGTAFAEEVGGHRSAFLQCMDDDFNTGGAIGVLYELLTSLNRFADTSQLERSAADQAVRADFQRGVVVLKELSQILGIFHEPPPDARQMEGSPLLEKLRGLLTELHLQDEASVQQALAAPDASRLDALMKALIELRARSRKAKNFALADQIRQKLAQQGITLEDRPGGTGWRVG